MELSHKFGHSAAAQNQINISPLRGFFFATLSLGSTELRSFR